MEWRYRAVIDKMKELSELSRIEVDHWKDAAARSMDQANEKLELLAREKKIQSEGKALIDEVRQSVSRANAQLDELAKANTFPSYISVGAASRRSNIDWAGVTSKKSYATQPSAPDKPSEEQ